MKTITTAMGDTWDTIALRAYGNVLRTQELMEARETSAFWILRYSPAALWSLPPT